LEALVQWDCRVLDMTPPAFHESVTSTAQLRELRAAASRWLSDSRIDDAAIETVALVLSETCTNAFIHGGADVVDIEITIVEMDGHGSTITILLRHDDRDPAALAQPTTMPPPDATFGRGLALVERLVDGMSLWIDPPQVVRTCWLRADGVASR
jgi:anti-sigma regulatory factor (Ser/Thr protein kinase)